MSTYAVKCGVERTGLVVRDGTEADGVAGLELTHFPELGVNDGGGADEAAEAGAVGAEDDGHVAGEVDGADGVGVVVNVGRMQAGFAAILARPLRLGTDEANAGAVGVVVDFPSRGEEHLDVFAGEEVWRSVRAVEDADLPFLSVLAERFRSCSPGSPVLSPK